MRSDEIVYAIHAPLHADPNRYFSINMIYIYIYIYNKQINMRSDEIVYGIHAPLHADPNRYYTYKNTYDI